MDCQILLTKEDVTKYYDKLIDFSNAFNIDEKLEEKEIYSLFDIMKQVAPINHWLNEYNLKLMALNVNHAYVNAYYEKLHGVDIFEEENSLIEDNYYFWFNYECESLLVRLNGLIDMFCKIVNEKFSLNLPSSLELNKEVGKELKKKGNKFGDFLINHAKDNRFNNLRNLRNEFTHSQSPLTPKSSIKKEDTMLIMTNKVEYTKPNEIMSCIVNFIKWYEELIIEYKQTTVET